MVIFRQLCNSSDPYLSKLMGQMMLVVGRDAAGVQTPSASLETIDNWKLFYLDTLNMWTELRFGLNLCLDQTLSSSLVFFFFYFITPKGKLLLSGDVRT